MTRGLQIGAAVGFLLFAGSFFLPAATNLPGYEAAWEVLSLPFRRFPDTLKRFLHLLIAWPANLVLLAAFVLLLLRRPSGTNYLAAYGLVGQLSWFLFEGLFYGHLDLFGVGYWVWLLSGIVLFAVSILAVASQRE